MSSMYSPKIKRRRSPAPPFLFVSPKWHVGLLALVPFLTVIGLLGLADDFDFFASGGVLQDAALVTKNPDVMDSFGSWTQPFSHDERGRPMLSTSNNTAGQADARQRRAYRPMAVLHHKLMIRLLRWTDKVENVSFRSMNVLLHAMTSALVVLWGHGGLGRGGRRAEWLSAGASLFAGLLFAVHPVHVEALGYTGGGRPELLCCFFYLLALLLHRASCLHSSRALFGLSLVCMLLASLSKEHGLTAPLMAALYQHYFPPCAATALPAADATADAPQTAPRRGGDKRGARPVALINLHFVALCCAAGVLLCGRLAVQGFTALQFSKEDNASTGTHPSLPLPTAALTRCYWASRQFLLLFWPLSPDSDWTGDHPLPISSPFDTRNAMTAVVLCMAVVLARLSTTGGGKGRVASVAVAAGLVWLSVAWLPLCGLPFTVAPPCSERVMYLPSVGFCIAVAGLLDGAWAALGCDRLPFSSKRCFKCFLGQWAVAAALLLAWLSLASSVTLEQLRAWESPLTLAEQGLHSAPGHAGHLATRAKWLCRPTDSAGEKLAGKKRRRAIPAYHDALKRLELSTQLWQNIPRNDATAAKLEKLKALRADQHNVFAYCLMDLGEDHWEEAAEQYSAALLLAPRLAHVAEQLAKVLEELDRHAEAVAVLQKFLQDNAGQSLISTYLALGEIHEAANDFKAAIGAFSNALQVKEEGSGLNFHVHTRVGSCLYHLGMFRESQAAFTRAIEQQPRHREALFGLGTVLIAQEKHTAAEEVLASGVAMFPDDKQFETQLRQLRALPVRAVDADGEKVEKGKDAARA